MAWMIKSIFKAMILPPGSLMILFVLIGVFYALAKKWLARFFSMIFIFGFYFLSTPYLAGFLSRQLEVDVPAFNQNAEAQAIVILGGGTRKNALEFESEDVANNNTLTRLVYGAVLSRKTKLPILVSGGKVESNDRISEAKVMANDLERFFSIKVRWTEETSRNTTENAVFTEEILAKEGITHILLVTEAWHMRRALYAFSNTKLKAIPAPTSFESPNDGSELLQWMPRAWALHKSSIALHEYLGILWAKITP